MFTGLNFANIAVDRAIHHFLRLNNSKVLEITSFIFSVYQCHVDFYFNASNRRKNESFKHKIESEYIVLDQIF